MNPAAKICTMRAKRLQGKTSGSSVHPYLWLNRSNTPQRSRLTPGFWGDSRLMTAGCRRQGLGMEGAPHASQHAAGKGLHAPVTFCSRRCFWKHPSPFARRGWCTLLLIQAVHAGIKHALSLFCSPWPTRSSNQPASPRFSSVDGFPWAKSQAAPDGRDPPLPDGLRAQREQIPQS